MGWGFKEKGTGASGRNRIRDLLLLPIDLFRRPRHFLKVILHLNTPIILAYALPSTRADGNAVANYANCLGSKTEIAIELPLGSF